MSIYKMFATQDRKTNRRMDTNDYNTHNQMLHVLIKNCLKQFWYSFAPKTLNKGQGPENSPKLLC